MAVVRRGLASVDLIMKRFFILIMGLFLVLSAAGQGTSIRSANGIGTNTTLRFINSVGGAGIVGAPLGDTWFFESAVNGVSTGNGLYTFSPQALFVHTNLTLTGGIMSGNGAGLTNLQGLTNPITVNITFAGKATFTSNVFFNVTSYSTNSAASTTTIDLAKDYRAFSTNNNTGFTNLASIEAAGTNMQSVNLFITNTSGSTKTIAMGPNFQNMNAIDGNILYLTNLGHLLVFYYPALGTNYYYKSR